MKLKKRVYIFIAVVFFTLLGTLLIKPYYDLIGELTGTSPLKILFLSGTYQRTNNNVNIVLLGKGGAEHEGPNLTDSITVVSYNLENHTIVTIAVPRDIWSSVLVDRINSAYAYGEAKQKGGGMILAKSEVGAVVGLPIHYAAVIDFAKFKELIDFVGGVDVDVETSFDDFKFPIPGKENETCNDDPEFKCRYEHISFKRGLQHMDGDTALKFVRSRNAEGDEGTDFARNKRQQKIISALFQKLIDQAKELRVDYIRQMYDLVDSMVERDFANKEAAYIVKQLALHASKNKLIHAPLREDFFQIPPRYEYGGRYVLIPTSDSFDEIHDYVACITESKDPSSCVKPPADE